MDTPNCSNVVVEKFKRRMDKAKLESIIISHIKQTA